MLCSGQIHTVWSQKDHHAVSRRDERKAEGQGGYEHGILGSGSPPQYVRKQ